MENFNGTLMSVGDFKNLLTKDPEMLYAVSGDESLLSQLPKGNWIGGTSPYMMTDEKGGLTTRDRLLVQQLPHDEQAPSGVSSTMRRRSRVSPRTSRPTAIPFS